VGVVHVQVDWALGQESLPRRPDLQAALLEEARALRQGFLEGVRGLRGLLERSTDAQHFAARLFCEGSN
jgi:hypothetical protein